MAFTASTSRKLLRAINSTFLRPTMTDAEFQHPVMSAKLFLERQNTNWDPITKGGICQGADVWFLSSGLSSLVTPSTDCTIPGGSQLQTLSKAYQNATPIAASVFVDDKCENETDFVTESARVIQKAMADIRVKLNETIIQLLAANVQPNQMSNSADIGITSAGAGQGNRLKSAVGSFNFEKLMSLRLLADQNYLNDYFILNGQNFYINSELAKIRSIEGCCNSDQARAFNQFDIHWDTRELDRVLGRRSTFIVNPGVIAFWNIAYNTPISTLKDGSKNLWVFTMEDPILMWNNNGNMSPVKYEIEYTYECTTRRSGDDQLVYRHKYYVRLLHGLGVAPEGYNRASTPARELTGILEIVQAD